MKVNDCSVCWHSCISFPTHQHKDGTPFCKINEPVTVNGKVDSEYLRAGTMFPVKSSCKKAMVKNE